MPITPHAGTEYLGRADEIDIVGGEDGFELHLETSTGPYVLNIHACAPMLLKAVIEEVVPWWEEREAARLSRPLRDDPDAYDVSDPKHPDWHSVHADLYPREAS